MRLMYLLIGSLSIFLQDKQEENLDQPFVSGSVFLDTIGKEIVEEIVLFQELGLFKKNKNLGLPFERLSPLFIKKEQDSLINAYQEGVYCFISSFSNYREEFNFRSYKFKEMYELMPVIQDRPKFDTIAFYPYRSSKFYYLFNSVKLKMKYVYIGKHFFNIPNLFFGKEKETYVRKECKTFLITQIY